MQDLIARCLERVRTLFTPHEPVSQSPADLTAQAGSAASPSLVLPPPVVPSPPVSRPPGPVGHVLDDGPFDGDERDIVRPYVTAYVQRQEQHQREKRRRALILAAVGIGPVEAGR